LIKEPTAASAQSPTDFARAAMEAHASEDEYGAETERDPDAVFN